MNCCWNGSIFSLDLESVLTAREQMSRKKSARIHLQSTDAIRDRFRVIRLSLKIRAIVLCNCISRVCKQRRTSTNIGGSVLTSVLIRPFLGLFAGHFIYEKRLGGNRICDYLPPLTVYLRLSNLQPIRFPSGPLPQTASDLVVRKALAVIGPRIFSRPKLICNSRKGFCAGFHPACAPLPTLGNSVINLSHRVAQNCAVLQPKKFRP